MTTRGNQHRSWADDHMSWVNQHTLQAVGFTEIWGQFQPCTPYGQRAKANMVPFLPGDDAAWQGSLLQLQEDITRMNEGAVRLFRQVAETLPDIEVALGLLAMPRITLPIKQLLLLKQFAYGGWKACEVHKGSFADTHGKAPFAWPTRARWRLLLGSFGDVENPSPTLDLALIAGEPYQRAIADHAAAIRKLSIAVRDRHSDWFARIGQKPNRDGRLNLPLPEHKTLAESLKATDGVRWLHETPFESVFEVLPTPAIKEHQDAVEQAKRALETLESAALSQLGMALRGHLPIWRQVVDTIADLDIRCTKVELAHRWHGCVPELGDEVAINGGVHPLVAEWLNLKGQSYVPLTMGLQYGANVLCGSNMGGKSVVLQLVAVCQLLAQYAMPVPAQRFCTKLFGAIRLVDAARTDTPHGLSAFGHEVVELTEAWQTAEELAKSGQMALLCIDEPGRSTNPVEGEALVVGLLRIIMQSSKSMVALVATHFAGALQQSGVRTYRVKGLKGLPAVAERDLRAREKARPKVDIEVNRPKSDVEKSEPNAQSNGGNVDARLAALSEAMDYQVQLTDGESLPMEGLRISRWLGLPTAIQLASEQYLTDSSGGGPKDGRSRGLNDGRSGGPKDGQSGELNDSRSRGPKDDPDGGGER